MRACRGVATDSEPKLAGGGVTAHRQLNQCHFLPAWVTTGSPNGPQPPMGSHVPLSVRQLASSTRPTPPLASVSAGSRRLRFTAVACYSAVFGQSAPLESFLPPTHPPTPASHLTLDEPLNYTPQCTRVDVYPEGFSPVPRSCLQWSKTIIPFSSLYGRHIMSTLFKQCWYKLKLSCCIDQRNA